MNDFKHETKNNFDQILRIFFQSNQTFSGQKLRVLCAGILQVPKRFKTDKICRSSSNISVSLVFVLFFIQLCL